MVHCSTCLELKIIKEKYKDVSVQLSAWDNCIEANRIVNAACENLWKKGEKRTVDELIAEVSEYATDSRSECLAECVADYLTNKKNASALAKEVWKILKEEIQ